MSAAIRRTAAEKLASLRSLMAGRFAAYVVPSGDAHSSEYVSAADKRREYISGFTGSAGTAVITAEEGAPARVNRAAASSLHAALLQDA